MTAPVTTTPLSITVLGGTGFTGSALVTAAAARGHRVTALSRTAPADPPAGVRQVTGSVLDEDVLRAATDGADVVLGALSPRGELAEGFGAVHARLLAAAAAGGWRLGVVGGSSSLRPAPGAPRIAEGDDLPPEFAAEARAVLAAVDAVAGGSTAQDRAATADWFVACPPMGYGAHAPAEDWGTWTAGDDVASFDPARAALSAADFAGAVLDEVEDRAHPRRVFSVTA